MRLNRFVDGVYVVATSESHSAILGHRVLRMGSMRMEDLWQAAEAAQGGDNEYSRMADVPLLLAIPAYCRALGAGDGGALTVAVSTPSIDPQDPQEQTVTLEPIHADPSVRWYYASADAPGGGVTLASGSAELDLPYRNQDMPYWSEFDSDGLQYVRINQISNAEGEVLANGVRAKLTFRQFVDRLMTQIDGGAVERVVIDLRDNGGGNNMLVTPLVDGLAARPSINRRGALFVITGRRTFSAAMNLVSLLEDRTRPIFVGEPPGGSPLHHGDATGFQLPSSHLTLLVSTLRWDLGVSPWDVRDVMEPDLPVPPSFNGDLRLDGALEKIRRYREGDALADSLLMVWKEVGITAALNTFQENARVGDTIWWRREQQLLRFGWQVIASGREHSGADAYRIFETATACYPQSFLSWFERGRVNAGGGRWKEAEAAYARAEELQPANSMVKRMHEVAKRKAAERPTS